MCGPGRKIALSSASTEQFGMRSQTNQDQGMVGISATVDQQQIRANMALTAPRPADQRMVAVPRCQSLVTAQ